MERRSSDSVSLGGSLRDKLRWDLTSGSEVDRLLRYGPSLSGTKATGIAGTDCVRLDFSGSLSLYVVGTESS